MPFADPRNFDNLPAPTKAHVWNMVCHMYGWPFVMNGWTTLASSERKYVLYHEARRYRIIRGWFDFGEVDYESDVETQLVSHTDIEGPASPDQEEVQSNLVE